MKELSRFEVSDAELPAGLVELRKEVREFLRQQRELGPERGGYARSAEGWDRYDPSFSRKVAQRGWIGMTWPRQYGGQARSALERYVVAEELLSAGAPVRAHWLADRQIGPLLLGVGTPEQKATYLPRIAAGECYICVGLSEPDSGLFPVAIAVVLVLFAALSLGGRDRPPGAATAERAGIIRVLVLIAALCAYAWFLPRAGFLICTVVLLAVVLRGLGRFGWTGTAVSAVAGAAGCYVLFTRWGLPLPAGVFGF